MIGNTCSAIGRSRHLFLRLFIADIGNGVAVKIHPGMNSAQFILSLLPKAASWNARRANIYRSTALLPAIAGSVEPMTSTVTVTPLIGLQRCERVLALMFERQPLIGA